MNAPRRQIGRAANSGSQAGERSSGVGALERIAARQQEIDLVLVNQEAYVMLALAPALPGQTHALGRCGPTRSPLWHVTCDTSHTLTSLTARNQLRKGPGVDVSCGSHWPSLPERFE